VLKLQEIVNLKATQIIRRHLIKHLAALTCIRCEKTTGSPSTCPVSKHMLNRSCWRRTYLMKQWKRN